MQNQNHNQIKIESHRKLNEYRRKQGYVVKKLYNSIYTDYIAVAIPQVTENNPVDIDIPITDSGELPLSQF